MSVQISTIGFPSIGKNRELKKATEAFWVGVLPEEEFLRQVESVKRGNFELQKKLGVDWIASNDFSLYDRMLDMSVMFGQIPERFHHAGGPVPLATYFAMARGSGDAAALEMTKWFDTNYHYLVPEISEAFTLTENRPLSAYRWAKSAMGLTTKPAVIGLYTYLRLAKPANEKELMGWMEKLAPSYGQMLAALDQEGVPLIQIEEPALVLGEDRRAVKLAGELYQGMARERVHGSRWILQTYFGHLAEHWNEILTWPFEVLGLDLARESRNRKLLEKLPAMSRTLAVGLVSGRHPWRSALEPAVETLLWLQKRGLLEGALLQPSTSLLHLPYTTVAEPQMNAEVRSWLAFGEERLEELQVLKRFVNEGPSAVKKDLQANRKTLAGMRRSRKIHKPAVQVRMKRLAPKLFRRDVAFGKRYARQMKDLALPQWPTTTIGSFPQTAEVRQARQDYIQGRLKAKEYRAFIDAQMRDLIRKQEALGLDVLVHGEFERTDMVEFFGQQLQGFVHTRYGWVQSYGTRYVRPPIIYGDVVRPKPMTTRETFFAQKLTKKPVKGMLTGPITILQWSFVREDISREDVAYQIALSLRDECRDLEQGGIAIIQVDEPALREGLPLKKADQAHYLRWAVRAFRLATSGVKPTTQIHTHMCYGDFSDVIKDILALDADVISLENARSHEELLATFRAFRYNHGIGPGVYDVHTPRVPKVEEMIERLQASAKNVNPALLWVNPDCGLKTRGWKETWPALQNMVQAALFKRSRQAVGRE